MCKERRGNQILVVGALCSAHVSHNWQNYSLSTDRPFCLPRKQDYFFRLSYTRQESWILLLGCDRSRLCKFIFLNNYEKKESVYVFRLLNTRGQPTFRFHLTKIVASCIRRVQTSILLETDIPSRPLLRSPSQIQITRPERRAGQLEQRQCKNHSKAREWF